MTISTARKPEPIRPAGMAGLSALALYRELWLTPKPGLVDQTNSGAHHDMDLPLFMKSIAAIAPWFKRFFDAGRRISKGNGVPVLDCIRPIGLACEQAMFSATGGINTHKGGIFSLGLLCAAAGVLAGRGISLKQSTLCREVGVICSRLVERELAHGRRAATVGERLYRQYGLTGARGEAASGFLTVRRYALPAWRAACAAGGDEEQALWRALLALMAHNPDTNLVSRGGLEGLRFVQRYARQLSGPQYADKTVLYQALMAMDQALTARNLSPGGSADLLAVTWLLAHYPT